MSGSAFDELEAACRAAPPALFLVLGSGMGSLIDRVKRIVSAPFAEVPGLPASSVLGHRGAMMLGEWAGRRVLVSEGRLHYYEGHDPEVIVRPIQLAARWGVRRALLTNAAGGIRDDLGGGSLMPVRDLLEWNRPEPWNTPLRPSPCSSFLLTRLVAAGLRLGWNYRDGAPLQPGTYAAVRGPTYETPAEVRALRAAGADAVGMSTNFELHAGAAAGMACAAISLVTNRAAGLFEGTLDHEEVLRVARQTADRLADLIEALLRGLM
jgi:purine-nucleoside phosphorylase